jgi:UDP-4-amino-4,6-dideoxy-N-acetyl-beta-L-altrosamine transaminase
MARLGPGRNVAVFLPYGRQSIDDDDVAAVVEALHGDFLTTGPLVGQFEAAFADACGAAHAVACSNGTTALHLAMLGLGLGADHSVIVPTVTFLASANAAAMVGAEVVFADVDPETGLMTESTLRDAMTRATRAPGAVVNVHLNGHVGAVEAIALNARSAGYFVVEDACHALTTRIGDGGRAADARGWTVGDGRHADAATFSFHPVKTITTGEGGAVTTPHADLADRLRRLRNHGLTRQPEDFVDAVAAFDADGAPNPWYYEMDRIGWNYRLSDLQCALGISQLHKLDGFRRRRKALARHYDQALKPLAPAIRPVAGRPDSDPCLHLYAVLCDFPALGMDRAAVMRHLRSVGIGSQVHYRPVHEQPYYVRAGAPPDLPGSARYYARQLSLPLFPAMTTADVDRVVAAIGDLV